MPFASPGVEMAGWAMSAATTLTLPTEDEADEAWRYWRQQFKALHATGVLRFTVHFHQGGQRHTDVDIQQRLQPRKGRRG